MSGQDSGFVVKDIIIRKSPSVRDIPENSWYNMSNINLKKNKDT